MKLESDLAAIGLEVMVLSPARTGAGIQVLAFERRSKVVDASTGNVEGTVELSRTSGCGRRCKLRAGSLLN